MMFSPAASSAAPDFYGPDRQPDVVHIGFREGCYCSRRSATSAQALCGRRG